MIGTGEVFIGLAVLITVVLTAAGMLIFLYGYGLLLIGKFREGRREARS